MSISKELMEAVNNKDVVMARIILKNNMLLDPSFSLYEETSAYVQRSLTDLFDAHDGEAFANDYSSWTKDYLDGLMVDLMSNFSKERVAHIRKVCAHIYGTAPRVQNKRTETSSRPYSQTNSNTNRSNDYDNSSSNKRSSSYNKPIGIGLAVGGAAAVVAGVVVSKPLIIGAGVVAAIAGGVIIATDK